MNMYLDVSEDVNERLTRPQSSAHQQLQQEVDLSAGRTSKTKFVLFFVFNVMMFLFTTWFIPLFILSWIFNIQQTQDFQFELESLLRI